MITNPSDYEKALAKIQIEHNFPVISSFIEKIDGFSDDAEDPLYQVCTIDANTRTINAPEYLSVQNDHQAETIYFKINRYYGHIDLSHMMFLVQYKNANHECYNYLVPYIDISHDSNYIYFPWVIESPVTRFAGKVTYSIKLFYVNLRSGLLSFEFNTLPAISQVKAGWGSASAGKLNYSSLQIDSQYLDLINSIKNFVSADHKISIDWVDVKTATTSTELDPQEEQIIDALNNSGEGS